MTATRPNLAYANGVLSRYNHDPSNEHMISVSNSSGLPGFGPGWNRPKGPGPGQEPPSSPSCSGLAGLLPGPDINPRFLAGLNLDRGSIFAVPATVAPIKYLSSDRITLWSVRRLCSFSPSFTSHCQIWNWTNIHWFAVKLHHIWGEIPRFSIATRRILVRPQIWTREVNERLKLHNLRTDHIVIRSELKYLIGAKIVDL